MFPSGGLLGLQPMTCHHLHRLFSEQGTFLSVLREQVVWKVVPF